MTVSLLGREMLSFCLCLLLEMYQRQKPCAKLFSVFLHKAALLLKGNIKAVTDQNWKHK